MMKLRILLIVVAALVPFSLAIRNPNNKPDKPDRTHYTPDWESIDSRPLPDWYDYSKIGIFVHWGVFSVPGFGCEGYPSEWYWYYIDTAKAQCTLEYHNTTFGRDFTYPEFAPMFKANLFKPDYWANLFAESGAKYVVLTSKHHDGFCNWDSAQSWNWNSVNTGPKKDLVGMLTKAVKKAGLTMGLYHSLFEFYHPLYLQDAANNFTTTTYVDEILQPQLKDIVNRYQPDVVWADGDWMAPSEYFKSTKFIAWLYNDSPVRDTVVINDRWGEYDRCKNGGFWTCQDNFLPGKLIPHKWENCFPIDGTSWGYNRNSNIESILPIDRLLYEVILSISCGGNVLINVGPTSDGTISPVLEERLLQMGSWLKINGDALYGTVPWRLQNETHNGIEVWYTFKDPIINAFIFEWPMDNTVELGLPIIIESDATVKMMGVDKELEWKPIEGKKGIVVTLPTLNEAQMPNRWAWTLQLEGFH